MWRTVLGGALLYLGGERRSSHRRRAVAGRPGLGRVRALGGVRRAPGGGVLAGEPGVLRLRRGGRLARGPAAPPVAPRSAGARREPGRRRLGGLAPAAVPASRPATGRCPDRAPRVRGRHLGGL